MKKFFTLRILAIYLSSSILYAEKVKNEPTDLSSKTNAPSITSVSNIASLRPCQLEDLININTATVEELQKLSTIGPKRAAAIVKYREKLPAQQFSSIEQLLTIPGISAKTFQEIQAYIFI